MDRMKWGESSHVFAALTILLWSTVFLSTRVLLRNFSSTEVGFIRYFTASVFLLGFLLVQKIHIPAWKDIPLFLLGGLTGFSVYVCTFNHAAAIMDSGSCSLIITTAPIMTAIFSGILFRERISKAGWLAMALQFAGIGVMTVWNRDVSVNQGVLWMGTAAVSISIYNVVQRALVKKGYVAIQITAYCIFLGTLFLGFTIPGLLGKPECFGLSELTAALCLGGLSGAVAYAFWSKAIQLADKTSQVTNYMFLIPLFSSVIGYLVEGERMSPSTIAGGGIIAVGFLIYILGNG